MRFFLFFILALCLCVLSAPSMAQPANSREFQLSDFLEPSTALEMKTEAIYKAMSDQQRVAQMIITSTGRLGKPYDEVQEMVKKGFVGGVIFLSGEPATFKQQIQELNDMSKVPLLFSIDAEPSLFNSRLSDVPTVPKTAQLTEKEAVTAATSTIDSTIRDLGFQQNFAPVIDLGKENVAIGNRSFGNDSSTVVPLAMNFVQQSSLDDVVSTVKHFPGHGRVAGDTHKKLVYIDGPLTEVSLYQPFIDMGAPSIMVGHIAIENNKNYNTDGMPATLSPVIVQQLLRTEMGFEGIIITDAMNMGAVASIPNSGLLAAKAGCDMILMPPMEEEVLTAIVEETKINEAFKAQIETSVKRIICLKLCLGMDF